MARRKRTIRLHAVREGDEIMHEEKWWQVKAHDVKPGDKFTGFRNDEKIEHEVPDFPMEISCALWVVRGRLGTIILGGNNALVTIIRTQS